MDRALFLLSLSMERGVENLEPKEEQSKRAGGLGLKIQNVSVRFTFISFQKTVMSTYHHLSQSDQSWAESGRSCDARTSCCSGYSRGCCCHLILTTEILKTSLSRSTLTFLKAVREAKGFWVTVTHGTASVHMFKIQHIMLTILSFEV